MKKFIGFTTMMTILMVIATCGTLQSTSADHSVTYDYDYNTMVETVEQAIRSSSLNISYAEESDNPKKYTIIFNAEATVGDESVQQDQGKAIVEKVGEEQTKVLINNPEYHFSVPEHQREKYDRILSNRIDSLLERQN